MGGVGQWCWGFENFKNLSLITTRPYLSVVTLQSVADMKPIQVKMRAWSWETCSVQDLVSVFYLDNSAMISESMSTSMIDLIWLVDVNLLDVIWGKFPCYTPQNTIMFEEIKKNFLMNPQNGLRIRPFTKAHKNREKDRKLLYLARYLKKIASKDEMSDLDHKKWYRLVDDQ